MYQTVEFESLGDDIVVYFLGGHIAIVCACRSGPESGTRYPQSVRLCRAPTYWNCGAGLSLSVERSDLLLASFLLICKASILWL